MTRSRVAVSVSTPRAKAMHEELIIRDYSRMKLIRPGRGSPTVRHRSNDSIDQSIDLIAIKSLIDNSRLVLAVSESLKILKKALREFGNEISLLRFVKSLILTILSCLLHPGGAGACKSQRKQDPRNRQGGISSFIDVRLLISANYCPQNARIVASKQTIKLARLAPFFSFFLDPRCNGDICFFKSFNL